MSRNITNTTLLPPTGANGTNQPRSSTSCFGFLKENSQYQKNNNNNNQQNNSGGCESPPPIRGAAGINKGKQRTSLGPHGAFPSPTNKNISSNPNTNQTQNTNLLTVGTPGKAGKSAEFSNSLLPRLSPSQSPALSPVRGGLSPTTSPTTPPLGGQNNGFDINAEFRKHFGDDSASSIPKFENNNNEIVLFQSQGVLLKAKQNGQNQFYPRFVALTMTNLWVTTPSGRRDSISLTSIQKLRISPHCAALEMVLTNGSGGGGGSGGSAGRSGKITLFFPSEAIRNIWASTLLNVKT